MRCKIGSSDNLPDIYRSPSSEATASYPKYRPPTQRFGDPTSVNGAAGGDRPELLDAVVADADIPVVEVDGGVAMAGDQADFVAEPEPVGGGRDGEAAVLVGGALVGGGGLVADERRA